MTRTSGRCRKTKKHHLSSPSRLWRNKAGRGCLKTRNRRTKKHKAATCIKAAVGCVGLDVNRVRKGVYDSRHSRDRLCSDFTDFGGHTAGKNQLVGRGEIGAFSKAH